MNILKVIHGYPPHFNAGSEVYTKSICSELSKRHSITIFTREENPYKPDFSIRSEKVDENLTICFLNNPRGKDGYKHQQVDEQLRQLISHVKPDVAHIGHLNHLSTGIVDVLTKANIPVVFTLHDFWLMCPRGQFLQTNFGTVNHYQLCSGQEDSKCASICYRAYFSGNDEQADLSYWSRWISGRMAETRSLAKNVDLFIAPSQYLRERFVSGFGLPKDKVTYLDYGFPISYLQPVTKNKSSTFTFGYIGTHIPSKGVHLMIEAFSKIKGTAELHIWGRENNPSTTTLKNLAQSCGNKVVFKGEYINKNLATEVFSNVDCIVVPSIWMENSPLVIHEAQACKVPVITADAGGMAEYVQHGKNGLLFSHRNLEDLALKMQYALTNPDTMRKMGSRGYLYSIDGAIPSIEDHCSTLEKLYEQIIESKCKQKVSGELQ